MGNASLKRRWSSWNDRRDQEEDREDLDLSELKRVELQGLRWHLSQDLLPDFRLVPPHQLWSADTCSTSQIMLSCYDKKGAMMMLEAALKESATDNRDCQFCHHTSLLRPRLPPKLGADFLKTQRRKLINGIQRLDTPLETLLTDGILNPTNLDVINSYAVQMEKNRILVDLVLRKGHIAQELFYKALSQSQPFLLQDMEHRPIVDKSTSEMSTLTKTMKFLVSDELSFFHWLLDGLIIGKSSPPTGGELLRHPDRSTTTTQQFESTAMKILLKIVPTLTDVNMQGEAVTSQSLSDIIVEKNTDTTVVEIEPEVFEECDMFRLCCLQRGVFRCRLTGLLLEGGGDVVYQMVPWDVDFLSSRGLRPAGPLFKFTLLTGSFHRLHLPHCQLLSDGDQHFLSVAHVTADSLDFITPVQVTESHVIVDVSGFSCYGLVLSGASSSAIRGLVLLFSELSKNSLFVLLLPRNIYLPQVIKEWKQRIRGEYVETIPDCELIPNETYRLSGMPVTFIQPESSKFLNFSNYNSFLPSFEVLLGADVRTVELQLIRHVTPLPLIGWLFGSSESVVWHRVVHLRAAVPKLSTEETVDVTLLLLNVLNSLQSEDLKRFQYHLSLWSNPIPISQLEAADRTRTVDLMVQQYQTEGAKDTAKMILRTMNYNQLASQL